MHLYGLRVLRFEIRRVVDISVRSIEETHSTEAVEAVEAVQGYKCYSSRSESNVNQN